MDLLSSKLPWELANAKWAATLNAVLVNPLVNGRILEGVQLVKNGNAVAHGLGRKLRGWFFVRIDAAVTVFDTQATNQRPDLTLALSASGPATVSIYVF